MPLSYEYFVGILSVTITTMNNQHNIYLTFLFDYFLQFFHSHQNLKTALKASFGS